MKRFNLLILYHTHDECQYFSYFVITRRALYLFIFILQEINAYTSCNDADYEYDEDIYSSDSSVDIDYEYLNFSKKTLEHQAKIRQYLFNIFFMNLVYTY